MTLAKLTDRFLDSIKPPEHGRLEFSDSVRPGLRLRVSSTGRKTWIYEKRIKGGLKRKHTLGPYPQVSISDARKQAAELELDAIRGIDRVREAQQAKAAEDARQLHRTSIGEVLELYDRLHIQNLRTAKQVRRMLSQALAPFLERSVDELRRLDLQKIIDAKAGEGALVSANRNRAALAHFARFIWMRGFTEKHIGDGLTRAVREAPRDRVLTLDELRQIWDASYQESGLFGPLLRVLMLTAQRRGDIAALRWSEVNFEKRRIELAGARTKNGRAHITHLSDPALQEFVAVRDLVKEPVGYVFTTNGRTPVSGFSVLKSRMDRRLGQDFQPWRLHDFRTAFATAMAEAGEPETVVDRVLNHSASGSAPSAVARVYNQSSQLPQRARLLDRWAELVTSASVKIVALPVPLSR